MKALALVLLTVLVMAGLALALPASPSYPNTAAQTSGVTTEVLVGNLLPDAGTSGTPVPASALSGRRSVEIQNNGPNAIDCTVDGTAPTLTKARRVSASGGTWALDASDAIAIKCKAVSADQVTGAATVVTELR